DPFALEDEAKGLRDLRGGGGQNDAKDADRIRDHGSEMASTGVPPKFQRARRKAVERRSRRDLAQEGAGAGRSGTRSPAPRSVGDALGILTRCVREST